MKERMHRFSSHWMTPAIAQEKQAVSTRLRVSQHHRTQRWRREAVKESKTARQLRVTINIKKTKVVDFFFQALRKKIGQSNYVMLPYGNGSFSPALKDEDSVPTGSIKRAAKRHMPTKSASAFRTSRNCPFCQQACIILRSQPASFSKLHVRQRRQSRAALFVCFFLSTIIGTWSKDKVALMNIRRGGIAEMQNKRRPYDLQNPLPPFVKIAASRAQGSVPQVHYHTDFGFESSQSGVQSSFCLHE